MSPLSSLCPSYFHPSLTANNSHHFSLLSSPSSPSTNPNLITYLYHTDVGLVSLTWSCFILGQSLYVHFHHHSFDSPHGLLNLTLASFHLDIKPFILWKKHGSKKLSTNTHIFWNLSRAKFGFGLEPNLTVFLEEVRGSGLETSFFTAEMDKKGEG